MHERAGTSRGSGLLLVSVLALAGASRPGGAEEALELHVDPRRGVDAPGGGDPEHPFGALSAALDEVERRGGADRITLRLAEGEYRGGESRYFPDQPLPASLPGRFGELSLIGPAGPEPRVRILESEEDDVVLLGGVGSERAWGAGESRRVRLEGVRFEGGRCGLLAIGPAEGLLRLELRGCEFEGSASAALEVVAGPGGRVELTVDECRFRGGGAGISLGARSGAEASIEVRDSLFEGMTPLGPDGDAGAAIEWHVDSGARLAARVERCVFRDTPAVGLLTSGAGPAEARLAFVSNLVHATGAGCGPEPGTGGEGCGVRHGFVVALGPATRVDLTLAASTFWGVAGDVFWLEEPFEATPETLRIAGDVFWAKEPARREALALFAGPAPAPASATYRLERNIVPSRSAPWLGGGADENRSLDPLLVDPAGLDFRPAPGSPLIDAGPASIEAEAGVRDLAGACRVSAGADRGGAQAAPGEARIDIGAFEAPGVCRGDLVRPFRRGDCDLDGGISIADPIRFFGYLFLGGERPACLDACDANDDGGTDITDGIYTLAWLFLGGPPPPPPFPEPGADPTPDPAGDCLRE